MGNAGSKTLTPILGRHVEAPDPRRRKHALLVGELRQVLVALAGLLRRREGGPVVCAFNQQRLRRRWWARTNIHNIGRASGTGRRVRAGPPRRRRRRPRGWSWRHHARHPQMLGRHHVGAQRRRTGLTKAVWWLRPGRWGVIHDAAVAGRAAAAAAPVVVIVVVFVVGRPLPRLYGGLDVDGLWLQGAQHCFHLAGAAEIRERVDDDPTRDLRYSPSVQRFKTLVEAVCIRHLADDILLTGLCSYFDSFSSEILKPS